MSMSDHRRTQEIATDKAVAAWFRKTSRFAARLHKKPLAVQHRYRRIVARIDARQPLPF